MNCLHRNGFFAESDWNRQNTDAHLETIGSTLMEGSTRAET
jgi:hypothetical protein